MAKAFDQLVVTVVANTTNPNILQGRLLDRSPFLAQGDIFATGSAAGLQATITSGMDTVCRGIDINAEDRIPITPDDLLVSGFIAQAGAQIGIAVSNITAGDLDVFLRIELMEMEVQYQ